LAVENFRSLERAEVTSIGLLSVFVGRNNAGKSSILGAVEAAGYATRGSNYDFTGTLTDEDPTRSFGLALDFALNESERTQIVDRLTLDETKRLNLMSGPFARHLSLDIKSPVGQAQLPLVRETRLRAADGRWAIFSRLDRSDESTSNPVHTFADFEVLQAGTLNSDQIDLGKASFQANLSIDYTIAQAQTGARSATVAMFDLVKRYFAQSFFFSPFRHAAPNLQVSETHRLSPDGGNLAQVLHTLRAGDSETFERIEAVLQQAVEGIGALQTPLTQGSTYVGFRKSGKPVIPVTRMGGGIEQLLMIATVLETTGPDSPLFLEEPESHLHPGAQRYLFERVDDGARQVFISTHSPVFLDQARSSRVFRVELRAGRSKVVPAADILAIGATLEDVGARRSDVLLSDAVLFVEGPADREILADWASRSAVDLASRNVAMISLGGAEHALRQAPIRSDLLHQVSAGSPIPHLFVLDRDERPESQLRELRRRLPGKVEFLRLRELENYLLLPETLVATILERQGQEGVTGLTPTTELVEQEIDAAAAKLYGLVLLKRIRARLAGLQGGVLDHSSIEGLTPFASDPDLSERLAATISARASSLLPVDLASIVAREQARLDAPWKRAAARRHLAPGTEVLMAVYRKHGLEFHKPSDSIRIAREIPTPQIPKELSRILKKAAQLGGRT
jgi:hypothetical protein